MLITIVYLVSPLLLLALLLAKKIQSKPGEWVFKPTLSLNFILLAFLLITDWSLFHILMFVGFILCFLGDVFLIPGGKKTFLTGLVSFLAGHIFYVGAFYQLAVWDVSMVIPLTLIVFVDFVVFLWLDEHIGEMRAAVLSYMAVISLMVLGASAVVINESLTMTGRVLILMGAISFFVSDLFVVREKFVTQTLVNPFLGLPLYYGAQFAMAMSMLYL